MENFRDKINEMYEINRYISVRVILKEPRVLRPFSKRIKTNKTFDENGRLKSYNLEYKPKKEFDLFLYKSTSGEICFSNKATRVKSVYSYQFLFHDVEIESIEYITDKKERDWDLNNRDYIIKNTHKNLWNEIIERLKQDNYKEDYLISNNSNGRIKTVSIATKLPKYVCKEIETAIENKTNYTYKKRGPRRDLSIEITLGEDGNLRAWYSSEYAGCLNGAYYLLINSKTAIFTEYD